MRAVVPSRRANSASQNWFNEFDQIFENVFEQKQARSFKLECDIEESEKFILFTFDLPGLSEEDFSVEVKESVLSIAGQRRDSVSDETAKQYRGRRFGSFMQKFALPKSVDQEKIEADYTNGVLKVLLPKKEVEKPKRIEVKTSKGGFLSDLLNNTKES